VFPNTPSVCFFPLMLLLIPALVLHSSLTANIPSLRPRRTRVCCGVIFDSTKNPFPRPFHHPCRFESPSGSRLTPDLSRVRHDLIFLPDESPVFMSRIPSVSPTSLTSLSVCKIFPTTPLLFKHFFFLQLFTSPALTPEDIFRRLNLFSPLLSLFVVFIALARLDNTNLPPPLTFFCFLRCTPFFSPCILTSVNNSVASIATPPLLRLGNLHEPPPFLS